MENVTAGFWKSPTSDNLTSTVKPTPISCNTQNAFGEEYQLFEYVINVCITTVLIIFGLLGNLISFVTLKYMKQASVMLLLRALAVADSVFLLTCLVFQSFRTLFVYSSGFSQVFWVFPYVYLVTWPLAAMSQTASVWLVVLVTFDRYQAICHALAMDKQLFKRRAKVFVLVVVVGSICFNIPTMFDLRVVDRRPFCSNIDKIDTFATELYQNPIYGLVYKTILTITFRAALPVALVIVLNTWIMCQIRRSEEYRAEVSRRQTSGITSINVMIALIVCVYVICAVPDLTYRILRVVKIYYPEFAMTWDQFAYFAQFSNLFLTINSSTNFIWYCVAGSKFRETLVWRMCGSGGASSFSSLSSKKTTSTTLSAPGTPLLVNQERPLSIPRTPQIRAAGKTLSFPIHGTPQQPEKSQCLLVPEQHFAGASNSRSCAKDVPTERLSTLTPRLARSLSNSPAISTSSIEKM